MRCRELADIPDQADIMFVVIVVRKREALIRCPISIVGKKQVRRLLPKNHIPACRLGD